VSTETELSPVAQAAEATGQPEAEAKPVDAVETSSDEPQAEAKEEPKPEKTAAEKELARERRRIAQLTRIRREQEAEIALLRSNSPLRRQETDANNPDTSGDGSETLQLTRAELQERIRAEAEKLAPTINAEQSRQKQLQEAAAATRKELGERFEELTDDLAAVLPAPKQLRVLTAEKPAALIQYLTDPENAAEADALAGMDDFDFGRALSRLETKAYAAAATQQPQRSNAATPVEPTRGRGTIKSGPPADTKAYIKWANERENQGTL
jgi:hypothetical protein